MDDAAAQKHGFPGRVAHGLLVLSLVDGLKNQTPAQFDAIASLGWDWTFSAPVFIGNVISARITVAEKRATRKADRGILKLDFDVTDQTGRTVEIPEYPQRIISLVPSQTELLHHLGLGDRVAGITKFCVHPEEWHQSKTRIGGTKILRHGAIDDISPDLIIANKEENTREDI